MKKALPLIVLVVLGAIAFIINQHNKKIAEPSPDVISKKNSTSTKTKNKDLIRGLNRHPSHLNYSKHALCRMGCRHINESEVKEILIEGKINYNKSELKGDDCKKKYAVEGYTKDDQKVRIIFAPCQSEVTVVTVIDLGKEWICDCE